MAALTTAEQLTGLTLQSPAQVQTTTYLPWIIGVVAAIALIILLLPKSK